MKCMRFDKRAKGRVEIVPPTMWVRKPEQRNAQMRTCWSYIRTFYMHVGGETALNCIKSSQLVVCVNTVSHIWSIFIRPLCVRKWVLTTAHTHKHTSTHTQIHKLLSCFARARSRSHVCRVALASFQLPEPQSGWGNDEKWQHNMCNLIWLVLYFLFETGGEHGLHAYICEWHFFGSCNRLSLSERAMCACVCEMKPTNSGVLLMTSMLTACAGPERMTFNPFYGAYRHAQRAWVASVGKHSRNHIYIYMCGCITTLFCFAFIQLTMNQDVILLIVFQLAYAWLRTHC